MPKAARVSLFSAPDVSSKKAVSANKSEAHPLVTIAIFSGIGLLLSLIAILCGVQGVWD